ncbi:hypothetical protein OROMI_021037 [Orobanche minor]
MISLKCILDNLLKKYPVLLPELYPHLELSSVIEFDYVKDSENMSQPLKESISISQSKKRNTGKSSSSSANLNIMDKFRQTTIVDIWRKAGAIPSQDALKEDVSVTPPKSTHSESEEIQADKYNILPTLEISAHVKCLEVQKYKFRHLSVDCLSLLACLEKHEGSCCEDPSAE